MFKFLIKKSFFDGWDNFLPLFLSNITFSIVAVVFYTTVRANMQLQIGTFALICALFFLILCFIALGISGSVHKWANYSSEFFEGFKNAAKKTQHLFFFYALAVLVFFCIVFLIPFYLSSHSYMGIIITVIMFWAFLLIIPSMQYYFPLANIMDEDTAFMTFKKCLALTLNNKLFTLGLTIKTIVELAISICTCFIVPGFAGIALSHADAVKLLLIRHNYMREYAIEKKDINIYRLLEEENTKLGPRSIRNMIFSWKDSK